MLVADIYIAKKPGWSDAELDDILALPPRRHEEFGTDVARVRWANATIKNLQPFAKVGRKILGL